jgi:hypothetical protein
MCLFLVMDIKYIADSVEIYILLRDKEWSLVVRRISSYRQRTRRE